MLKTCKTVILLIIKNIFIFAFVISGFSAVAYGDVLKDRVYASLGDRQLKLDIYTPENNKNPFLVVWIHGGAWHSGSKEDPPLQLLEKGYALASVEYRLSPEEKFPAPIHDIKAAIRFLRANAETYHYRADKIAIWGSSAGGHLAALVGVTNGHTKLEGNMGRYLDYDSSVQATVDYFGPTNFLSILAQSTPHGINVRAPALALLLGRPVDQVKELAELASPVAHVDKNDPPMLIMHGDQDYQVPINQSHELEGQFIKHGASARLVVVHGAGHSTPEFFTPEYIEIVDDFLKKSLGD